MAEIRPYESYKGRSRIATAIVLGDGWCAPEDILVGVLCALRAPTPPPQTAPPPCVRKFYLL